MNTLISVSTLLATMTSAGADPKSSEFTVIEDLSSLPLLNPDLAERKTAKLRLHNNLEILLVSDHKALILARTSGPGTPARPPRKV